jgi:hypothetical protein
MPRIGFKEQARRHQKRYREEVLQVGPGAYETVLTDKDASKGLIFYDGFDIFNIAQKRYPHFSQNKACYANMLRSEHIPFNIFVPLSNDLKYASSVLNDFVGGVIDSIAKIKIEYAPDPLKALKDKTSFDAYIEYKHINGSQGILGIEVKYTEKSYKLKNESKEAKEMKDLTSIYYTLTDKIGLYNKNFLPKLPNDEFRQIWRNQLLGESMTRSNHEDSRFTHFTSVIVFPEGNEHFKKIIPVYKSFLNAGYENKLIGITYEAFIQTARKHTDDQEYLRWLQYLEDRYIVCPSNTP